MGTPMVCVFILAATERALHFFGFSGARDRVEDDEKLGAEFVSASIGDLYFIPRVC